MPDKAGSPVRILLLEDSDIDAELLTGHLAKADVDFQIKRVIRRDAFVQALDDGGFDLIIADYSLPDFDGLAALELSQAKARETPFIFLSGIVGEEFATNALRRGATDYVLKRNLSRMPTSIDRALADAHQRAERRKAEAALRDLNATLEMQVEARTRERDRIWRLSRDLFAVADAAGRLHAINPAWGGVLGHSAESVLAAPFTRLVHDDDRKGVELALEALRRASPSERFEGRFRHADGGWRWVAWTAVAEGDVFYAVGRDVTEEKAAAAELAEANRNLREQILERERVEATLSQMQRLEAVGQLTSGVAHDFNNLLTVILGNVDFIERSLAAEGVDGRLKRRVGYMRSAAERGAKLTAQLLAFSRRQRLEPKAVDLNEIVDGLRDLLQSTLGGSVKLQTVLTEDVWPALVDPTQIEMVILNLAINARDAMDVGGGLTVRTDNVVVTKAPSRPEEPAPGDYVALVVSDTGSGMTRDVLAKAFEPFFTTKAVGKGSGLGLAQVFGFAKQSGGGIGVDTKIGEGTAITVYLPRAADLPEEVSAPPPSGDVPPPSGQTVLLVDDDASVREVTAAMLADFGYTVIEADSAPRALEILDRRPVDILLMDYAMPGMNGAEAAASASRIRPGLPILFITGYADLGALAAVAEDRIISKPYQREELRMKLAKSAQAPRALTGA